MNKTLVDNNEIERLKRAVARLTHAIAWGDCPSLEAAELCHKNGSNLECVKCWREWAMREEE